ncbi:MAG TPA: transporter permease, partial [Cytophagales bacterium]|nr:transporter permease [Cytophagales bacterium]
MPTPPKSAQRLLRGFLRPELTEEVFGDLEERFEDLCETASPAHARRHYWYQVFHYLRPFAIRKPRFINSNNYVMHQHHLLMAFRQIRRYKGSFLINFIGLASGLSAALLIGLWIQDEFRVDRIFPNEDHLYQVMLNREEQDGEITTMAYTAGPLADALMAEIPEIEAAAIHQVSFSDEEVLVYEDTKVLSFPAYGTPNYFSVLPYTLLWGSPDQVLTQPDQAVLTRSMAIKLFGNPGEALGKTITGPYERPYTVAGIMEDVPSNASIQFDALFSWTVFLETHRWLHEWGNQDPYTLVTLRDNTDLGAVQQKLSTFLQSKMPNTSKSLFLRPYTSQHLYGKYVQGQQAGGRIVYVRLFMGIAIAILLIACVNFMNLSTAHATRRSKEVGIKKALGARKPLLTGQFMEEAFVHVLLALVGAYLLTAILLPGFNQFTGKSLSLWSGWQLLLVMLGVALAAGWVAGSYPALYLSRLSPIRSLKGQNQPGTRSLTIRRGLVVFQFTLSVIFILGVIIIAQQMAYIQNKDLGFNKDQIIYFSHDYVLEDDTDTYYTFLEDLRQLPEVSKAASFSHDLAGNHGGTSGLTWPGKDPDTRIEFGSLEVGPGFLDALSVPMVAGSTFPPPSSDTLAKIIFNEAAIAAMGLTDPVGKIITLWGEPKEIVGVTKNIHFESLYEPITPCFFNMYPVLEKTLVKAETENLSATLAAIRAIHDRYSPNHPLTFQFMDDDFAKQYAAEQQLGQLSRYFAGIAILISCLGLLGLAAFSA